MSVSVFFAPKNISELQQALNRAGDNSRTIAGCTDFLAKRNGVFWHEDVIVSVADVQEMKEISLLPDRLSIGAACVHRQIAEDPWVRKYFPALSQACGGVGSPQIRNRGTIGGNLVNASPAGDMLPVMLVLAGEAVIFSREGTFRKMPVDRFVVTQGKSQLVPGEVLFSVELPLPAMGNISAFVKLGERSRVTIAKLSAAVSLRVEDGVIREPMAALGAVASRALVSREGISALEGAPMTHETFDHLGDVLSQVIEGLIPTRSTMPYKRAAIRGVADDLWMLLRDTHSLM